MKNQKREFTKEEIQELFVFNGKSCNCPDCGSELRTFPFEQLPEVFKPQLREMLNEEPYKNEKVEFVFCPKCDLMNN